MGEPLKTRSPAVVVVRPNVTISMVSGVQLLVPHGGIFAALIPGAATNLLPYLSAIVSGTVVTTAALFVLKRQPLRTPTRSLGRTPSWRNLSPPPHQEVLL